MSNLPERQKEESHIPLGVVTIHDACPAFSAKIFKSADELERLNIHYNIALVPFFNEKNIHYNIALVPMDTLQLQSKQCPYCKVIVISCIV